MSRIIRGKSDEIKSVKIRNMPSSQARSYTGAVFKTIQVEGTVTLHELEEKVQTARAEGKREGYVEAEKKLGAPLRGSLENVEKILDEISHFRRELFKEAEGEVLELIKAVGKKVFAKEISFDPNALKGIVEKALEILEKQKKIVLQINPSDYQFFVRAKADFLEKFKGIEELELLYDSQVQPGTVVLKSKTVQLDVNLVHRDRD